MWIYAHEYRFHQRPEISPLGAGMSACSETSYSGAGNGTQVLWRRSQSTLFLEAGSLTRTRVCRLSSVTELQGSQTLLTSDGLAGACHFTCALSSFSFSSLGRGGWNLLNMQTQVLPLGWRALSPFFSAAMLITRKHGQIGSVRILVSFLSNHNTEIGRVCMLNKEKLHFYLLGGASLFLPIKRNQRNKECTLIPEALIKKWTTPASL